ncbi:MAG: hypothetical protein K2O24_00270 [Muribaculaceae bacterium]|nr:hypothetical protein [Muribaculaceae bacterium]
MSRIVLGAHNYIGASAGLLNALAGEDVFPLYIPNVDIILRPSAKKECRIHYRPDSGKKPVKKSFSRLHSVFPDIDTLMADEDVTPYTLFEVYLPLPGLNKHTELFLPCTVGEDFRNSILFDKKVDGIVWLSSMQTPLASVDVDNITALNETFDSPVDLVLLDTDMLPRDEMKQIIEYFSSKLHPIDPDARIVICNPSDALDAQAYGFASKLESSGIGKVRELLNTIGSRPAAQQPKTQVPAKEAASGKNPSEEIQVDKNLSKGVPAPLSRIGNLPRTLGNLELIKAFYDDMAEKGLPELADKVSGIIEEFVQNINPEDISLKQPSRKYADLVSKRLPVWLNSHTLKHRNSFTLMLAGGSKTFGKEACEELRRHESELIKERESIFVPVMKKRYAEILRRIVPELERAADTLNAMQGWMPDSQTSVVPDLEKIRALGDEKTLKEDVANHTLYSDAASSRMGQATSSVEYNQKNTATHGHVLDAIRSSAHKETTDTYHELGNALRWGFISALKVNVAQFDRHFRTLCSAVAGKARSSARELDPALGIAKHLGSKL